ncbi:MAG: hypothetical protein NVS2B7_24460 [Herpetosiphon sp.]
MQYFKPPAAGHFVGDCMPFFHNGTFHLFYLLDEEHHKARNGFGAHQWAHAASDDLVHWQHHPLAIPVGAEHEFDYLSICTGSVFYYEGTFYAFYATRRVEEAGKRSEHLCCATSSDGIHFTKDPANPIASPHTWYDSYNFRDPFVFRTEQDNTFHMLVTACESEPQIADRAGCLAHLVSSDLRTWELQPPFLAGRPGRPGYSLAPECCDYFYWHGWYYLVFSDPPHATTYRMARDPFGPWCAPANPTFDAPMLRVFKTAAFTGDRRLAVAFLESLADGKDDGAWQYAGHAVFRELIQHADGTLGTKWPVEMLPQTAFPHTLPPGGSSTLHLTGHAAVPALASLAQDVHMTFRIVPGPAATYFGVRLGSVDETRGHELRCAVEEQSVSIFASANSRTLHNRTITHVMGLDDAFIVDIVMYGDIVDICVNNQRCLCTRLPERMGDTLAFFSETGDVSFQVLNVRPLVPHST